MYGNKAGIEETQEYNYPTSIALHNTKVLCMSLPSLPCFRTFFASLLTILAIFGEKFFVTIVYVTFSQNSIIIIIVKSLVCSTHLHSEKYVVFQNRLRAYLCTLMGI